MGSTDRYDLVLEGLLGSDRDGIARIWDVLTEWCTLPADSPETLVTHLPLTLTSCNNVDNLTALREAITSAGGRVTIVRKAPPAPIEPDSHLGHFIARYVDGLASTLRKLDFEEIRSLIGHILTCRDRKGKILLIGNGGSAAIASHMAVDLNKLHFGEEYAFRALSLTDNTPWLLASGNDDGCDTIFVNQLRHFLEPNDLVIAISSSGNSKNIVAALEYAKGKCLGTCAVVGFDGGIAKRMATNSVHIPTKGGHYGFAEDASAVLGHIIAIYLCEYDRRRKEAYDQ